MPDTRSLSDMLVKMHETYRPHDWSNAQAYEQFARVDLDVRTRFEQICAHLKPAMHHWFVQQYSDPFEWFRRRQAYTRSVASNSVHSGVCRTFLWLKFKS